MKLTRIVIAISALALLVAGCSKSSTSNGSKTISKAEWASQGNAICEEDQAKLDALAVPGDPAAATEADLPAWSKYFDDTKPIVQDLVTRLTGLPDPDADQDKVNAVFQTFGDNIKALTDADTAAKAGKLDDFKTAMNSVQAKSDLADTAATDAGLNGCVGGGSSSETPTEQSTDQPTDQSTETPTESPT